MSMVAPEKLLSSCQSYESLGSGALLAPSPDASRFWWSLRPAPTAGELDGGVQSARPADRGRVVPRDPLPLPRWERKRLDPNIAAGLSRGVRQRVAAREHSEADEDRLVASLNYL